MYLFLKTEVVVGLFWLPRAVLCCCLGLHEARNSCKAWFPSPAIQLVNNASLYAVSRHEFSHLFSSTWISLDTERTKSRQKFEEFSSLLFSHLYSFSLRFIFLQTHATSYICLLYEYTVKEKGGKHGRKKTIALLPYLYRNIKSKNSQDNAQKPQRNCTFMNLAPRFVSEFFFMKKVFCKQLETSTFTIHWLQVEAN